MTPRNYKSMCPWREVPTTAILTIEALDPLAAFIPLAAHIEHAGGDKGHLVISSQRDTTVTARGHVKKPLSPFGRKWKIHLLEVDFVHLELGLKDSRGQDAAAKQVLKQSKGQWISPTQWKS